MDKNTIEKFKNYFTQMDLKNNTILKEIYAEDVLFTDPIHKIQGIDNLSQYFNKLNDNLIEGTFQFTEEALIDNKAYLSWDMKLKLKKPKKRVQASGISVLTIEDKVISQRDYFDTGELFYENVPVLGGLIRSIKRKIAS